MRPSECTMALALTFLLSSFGAGQVPPTNSRVLPSSSSRDITVVFDPELPISFDTVNEIIQSKQLAAAAIDELTGEGAQLSPSNEPLGGSIPGWVIDKSDKVYFAHASRRRDLIGGESRGSLPLRLFIQARGQSEAEKYADLVVKHLNKVLADLSRRGFERKLAQLKAAATEAQNAADLAGNEVAETRARIRNQSSGLSISVLEELISDLKKTQQSLEVELAGMKGRAERLQAEVAKVAERVKKEPTDDEVLRNLMRVTELRKNQLTAARQAWEQGAGKPGDVSKAEEQVALALVELAQAKRSASRPNTDQLDKLNDELSHIFVNVAENEAKLKYVIQRLDEQLQMLKQEAETKPLREQLENQTTELLNLQAEADKTAARVRQLESSFRPARVEVFELTADTKKGADAEKEGQ
jgi:hypothetical protein